MYGSEEHSGDKIETGKVTPSSNGRNREDDLAKLTPARRAEAAREAALQATQAIDPAMPGGASLEPAVQAEQVAGDALRSGSATAPVPVEISSEERREIGRTVFKLAWPAITENALQTLLGIVDTAVVARLGTDALSGVGAGQQLIFVFTTAFVALSMGTTVLVGRFTGSNRPEKASAVLKQSLVLAVIAGLLLAPIALAAHPLMLMLGLTGAAATDGATYFGIVTLFAVFLVVMLVASAALRGAGDTRTPMMVTGFINVINIVLAILLVFGGANIAPWLGWIPALGVAGSAWAAVAARGVGMALLLSLFLLPGTRLQLWYKGGWRFSLSLVRRILNIGIPSAIEQLGMSLGILIYSLMVISLGEQVFATSRIAINTVFISQMPGFGFSIAATTLVAQNLGAGRPHRARLSAWLATRSAMVWMTIMGLVFFFSPEPILRIFTDDPQLIHLGDAAMKVIAFNQPALAVAFVLAGALRGAGDVRYPMVVTTVAVWLVRLPVAAYLGLPAVCVPFTSACTPGLNLGLPGVYGALIVEAVFRAILLYIRFRSGRWQSAAV